MFGKFEIFSYEGFNQYEIITNKNVMVSFTKIKIESIRWTDSTASLFLSQSVTLVFLNY
jgi:hypothetical protein